MSNVVDLKNDLTVEWKVNNLLSPRRVVQCYLKYGKGALKSTFLYLVLLINMTWNPLSGD